MSNVAASSQFMQTVGDKFGNGTNALMVVVLVGTVVLATVPLQIPELTLSLVGAIVYSALQIVQGKTKRSVKDFKQKVHSKLPAATPTTREWNRSSGWYNRAQQPNRSPGSRSEPAPKKEFRQSSIAPILAPTFEAVGWEGEVQELLQELAPTPEGVQVVQLLVQRARSAIKTMIPEAEVTGFGSGKLKRGKAFGVAVPDVDIVVSVSPGALVQALQRHLRSSHVAKLDARKLQKSAIRACTDLLVSAGGFKFRRSAFKGQDPKVTLLAPVLPGVCEEAIPVDLSVNSATPLHNAVLLTECGQLDSRAKQLVLFVQRWARDRGISHAAKGHLPPYAWNLLTLYFLQVGVVGEDGILPALEGFERAAELAGITKSSQVRSTRPKSSAESDNKSVAALFKEFVDFYELQFNWRTEAVSVRRGVRGSPELSLPIHVAVCEDGSTVVAPSIEDPFDVSRNHGSFLTGAGCLRLREELSRASACFVREASLGELLEPWAPPEWGSVDA